MAVACSRCVVQLLLANVLLMTQAHFLKAVKGADIELQGATAAGLADNLAHRSAWLRCLLPLYLLPGSGPCSVLLSQYFRLLCAC